MANAPGPPSLGVLTQPISCIGCPSAPMCRYGAEPLPIGVSHRRPGAKIHRLRVAHALEQAGVVSACRHLAMTPLRSTSLTCLPKMQAVFDRHEDALVHNKVEVLDELFWEQPTTVRYGAHREPRRLRRHPGLRATARHIPCAHAAKHRAHHLWARLRHRQTEFVREGSTAIGRQSQTWVRFRQGWRVVAAHAVCEPFATKPLRFPAMRSTPPLPPDKAPTRRWATSPSRSTPSSRPR